MGKICKKNALIPRLWDESITLRGATQIQSVPKQAPFVASWYGEGAVGVSAPAPPLSFLRPRQDAFSDASLSVEWGPKYCCGIRAV